MANKNNKNLKISEDSFVGSVMKAERNSVAEQSGIQPQSIGSSELNQAKPTEIKPDERIWRTCPKCKHRWLGVPTSDKCPKCKKFIGKPKEIKQIEGLGGIKVEKVPGSIPSIPTSSASSTPADIPAETYANVASFPFDFIAGIRKKDCWKLTETEKKSLEPLLKKIGDKWIGKWFDKYPEEAALAIVAGIIILGKIALDVQDKKVEQKPLEMKP